MYHSPLLSLSLGIFLSFSLLVENTVAHVYEPVSPVAQQATTGMGALHSLPFIAIAQNSPFKCTEILHRDNSCNIFLSQNPDFSFPYSWKDQEVF